VLECPFAIARSCPQSTGRAGRGVALLICTCCIHSCWQEEVNLHHLDDRNSSKQQRKRTPCLANKSCVKAVINLSIGLVKCPEVQTEGQHFNRHHHHPEPPAICLFIRSIRCGVVYTHLESHGYRIANRPYGNFVPQIGKICLPSSCTHCTVKSSIHDNRNPQH